MTEQNNQPERRQFRREASIWVDAVRLKALKMAREDLISCKLYEEDPKAVISRAAYYEAYLSGAVTCTIDDLDSTNKALCDLALVTGEFSVEGNSDPLLFPVKLSKIED